MPEPTDAENVPAAVVDAQALPSTGRLVAIDLGEVRVGVAISDPAQVIASPGETVHVPRDEHDPLIDALARVMARHDAVGAVIGHPRRPDGREGAAARHARRVAGALAARTGVPVALWDERYTTVEAQRLLLSDDVSRADRREVVDQVAAAVLLQAALDARRRVTGSA